MQRIILSFVAGCILATEGTALYAFDNNKVHRSINENAAQQSELYQYVHDIIGFDNGLDTYFEGKKIIEHLKDGGTTEDRFTRPFKHFHDPLEPWEKAGLSWAPGLHSTSCLIWAQNYIIARLIMTLTRKNGFRPGVHIMRHCPPDPLKVLLQPSKR